MNVNDLIPWIPLMIVLIGGFGALFRWRSQIIFVDPKVLTELQGQNRNLQNQLDKLSDDLSDEWTKRRQAEARLDSLEHDARESRTAMLKLEAKISDWSKGIEILIAQIERHNDTPEWRPAKESNDGN